MITQATSNQSFVISEDGEYGGEGLADAEVVAQLTNQSTAHKKRLDEVAGGEVHVDIAQDDEIGNDELHSVEEEEATIQSCSGEQDKAEFGSECLAEADSEGWICSSNDEEQNSASAVVHVRECERVHQMQSVPVPVMYCVPVRPTAYISEVLSIVKDNFIYFI